MGGSTTTTETPSLLDITRANVVKGLGPDVVNKIFTGLRQYPTADQMVDLYSKWRGMSAGLGMGGVNPGDPRILKVFGDATKGAFGVNHDALNAAIQLFTGTPGSTGGSQSSTTPGAMDVMGGLAGLGLGGAMLGSAIGASAGTPALAGIGATGAGLGSAAGVGAGLGGSAAGVGAGLGGTVSATAGGSGALTALAPLLGLFGLSSRDLKQDIAPLKSKDCLDKVCSLRSVEYKWKHNAQPDAGLIAEELMEVIPEAGGMVGGYNGIKPLTVIGYLVESIKELNSEIRALKAQNGGDG